MKYQRILTASKSEQIDALIEGLPVNANGFFLTEDQMDNVEAALEASETANADVQAQLAAAQEAGNQAAADLKTANETIATRDARIAELEAANAELQKAPKTEFSTTTTDKDNVGRATQNKFHTSVDEEAAKLRSMLKK